MSVINKTKVAVVGAGNWGLQHARILSQRVDVDFCAVVGRTPQRVSARAKQFNVRGYTSIAEMLAKEQPDLVCLSLPNEDHFEPTLEVIRAGVPVFAEKPLVFDLKQAEVLVCEAEKQNLFFGINFNHRYAKPVTLARHAIEAGRLGQIVFSTWRFGGEGGLSHQFNNLIETQCHGFDMLEFLAGPITSVMAQMTDLTHRGTLRTLALALGFQNGAVGTLMGSYDSSYAYPGTHRVEINGSKGRIVIDDTVRRYTFNEAGNETAEVWEAGYFNDIDRGFYLTFDRHMDAVLEAFRQNQPPPVHARAGRRALELAMASIESFETGKRVTVSPETFDLGQIPKIMAPPPNP